MKFRRGIFFYLLLQSVVSSASVLERAKQNALDRRVDSSYWNFPAYLGRHYSSQYYLLQKWLGRPAGLLDPERLKAILLGAQLPNGSWEAVREAGSQGGDLSASILNYAALKAMGLSTESETLTRARQYILSRGGIDGATVFTKIFLALFGNYSWKRLPTVPLAIFSEHSPLKVERFGQWIGPHLTPLAYLRDRERVKDLGPLFRLRELSSSWELPASPEGRAVSTEASALVDRMLRLQRPQGSWGGYTLASLFSVVALQDYSEQVPSYQATARPAIERALGYVEQLSFDSGESSYLGVVDDGRYWDTALVANALLDSGLDGKKLQATGEYLARVQRPEGGFPFGQDFEVDPDTDDTAEIILTLVRLKGFESNVQKAVAWLDRMQNTDGSWGAFARNNIPLPLVDIFLRPFKDSASFYDESCADIAGHVLEAFAATGRTVSSSPPVQRAVNYLEKTQAPSGAWSGRWGMNYLYGTGAAVVGLLKAGVSLQSPMVQRALQWLRSKQNADGGFGESSLSYRDPALAGVGPSTPTQTAWALLALLEAGEIKAQNVERSVAYLLQTFERTGRWEDVHAVGTGHPGTVYMEYPSYPYAFPLSALARSIAK